MTNHTRGSLRYQAAVKGAKVSFKGDSAQVYWYSTDGYEGWLPVYNHHGVITHPLSYEEAAEALAEL